jgi:hypothetical protein
MTMPQKSLVGFPCATGQWGNRLGPMVGENGLMFGDVSDDIENYCMMVATFV